MNRSPRWIGDRGLSPPPQSKRQRWMKPALIGCGGLLGLCVVITIIAALFANGDDNEDDNQATVRSRATQRALPPSQPNRRRLRRLHRSTRSHAERRPGNEPACTHQHARTSHSASRNGCRRALRSRSSPPTAVPQAVTPTSRPRSRLARSAISTTSRRQGPRVRRKGSTKRPRTRAATSAGTGASARRPIQGERGSGDGYLRRCEREREHHDRIAPLCAGLGLQTDKMIYLAPANEVAGAVFLSPTSPDRTVRSCPMSQVYRHSAHHDS